MDGLSSSTMASAQSIISSMLGALMGAKGEREDLNVRDRCWRRSDLFRWRSLLLEMRGVSDEPIVVCAGRLWKSMEGIFVGSFLLSGPTRERLYLVL